MVDEEDLRGALAKFDDVWDNLPDRRSDLEGIVRRLARVKLTRTDGGVRAESKR